MEEKRKITSGDKIPGCERLTRPEEIKGLSKYLGAIRDTQEQWISENMPDEPLEGVIKVKELELPKKKEMLEDKDLELKTSRIDLSGVKDIDLKEELIRLKNVKDPDLPEEKEGLYVGKEPELPKDAEGLYVGPEPELPKDKELIHPSDPQLPTGLERLRNIYDPGLPDGVIGLNVDEKISLPKDKTPLGIEEPSVSLPKSKLELKNISDPNLPETLIGINVEDTTKLPDGKERLGNIEDPELPKNSIGLHVTEPDKLSDFIDTLFVNDIQLKQDKLGLQVTEPEKLPWVVLEIDPKNPSELPTDRLDIHPDDPELPNKRLDINPTDPGLPDTVVGLETSDVNELPKTILGIDPEEIKNLPDSAITLDTPEDPKRIEEVLDSMEANELYDELMKLLISGHNGREGRPIGTGNLELAGILSAYFSSPEITGSRAREAAEKIADVLEKQKKLLEVAGETILPDKRHDVPDSEKILSLGDLEGIRDEYSKKPEELRVKYHVPESTDPTKDPANFLNPAVYDQDRYIRRLAEIAADAGDSLVAYRGAIPGTNSEVSSSLRQLILKNTLMALFMARAKLERATKTDRSRLPGGNVIWQGVQKLVQGGLTGPRDVGSLIRGAANLAINTIANDTALPQNRPEGKSDILTGESKGTSTEELDRLNDNHLLTVDSTNTKGFIQSSIDSIKAQIKAAKGEEKKALKELTKDVLKDYKKQLKDLSNNNKMIFSRDYLASDGIRLTLRDLCPEVNPSKITTIEEFYSTLKESPYITTPAKIMNRRGGNLTLDTNAYWEVVINPFVSNRQNGGYSYLPSIGEINYENEKRHGVNTAYSRWIPISNFELQKSKLVSKSLGLFDGEINYPASIEYTNEFRITIVDDQYKSWRRYFQRCSDASVYYSEAHRKDFYSTIKAIPTAIDKTSICAAFYKNVAFNIKVYCMNPQYSTIKKFDLLCVMKDFMEEYSGEVDSGAADLTISFSIVGENPPSDIQDMLDDAEDRDRMAWIESQDNFASEMKRMTDELANEEMEIEEVKEETPPSVDPAKAEAKDGKKAKVSSKKKEQEVQSTTPGPTAADVEKRTRSIRAQEEYMKKTTWEKVPEWQASMQRNLQSRGLNAFDLMKRPPFGNNNV